MLKRESVLILTDGGREMRFFLGREGNFSEKGQGASWTIFY
jgi:hypothetical protein